MMVKIKRKHSAADERERERVTPDSIACLVAYVHPFLPGHGSSLDG